MTRTGSRVLEVGANIGWHTLLVAERVGPSGRVVAFEPNPLAFTLLHLNIFVNGYWDRCRVEQLALSDSAGTADLHVVGSFLGSGRLRPFNAGDLAWHHQTDHSFQVRMSTLDEAVGDDPHFDILKIDVEGAEAQVFAGAAEFFKSNPRLSIILEFTPRHHGPEMLAWLRGEGFLLYSISRAGTLTPVIESELMRSLTSDILARRK
jgi:FkbM family methyltransferase